LSNVELREQLKREIPQKDLEANLLLATWNIRKLEWMSTDAEEPKQCITLLKLLQT